MKNESNVVEIFDENGVKIAEGVQRVCPSKREFFERVEGVNPSKEELIEALTPIVRPANFVTAYGSYGVGLKTRNAATFPLEGMDDIPALKVSAELILDVHTALLEVLPRHHLERILKAQAFRLHQWLSSSKHSGESLSPDELLDLVLKG